MSKAAVEAASAALEKAAEALKLSPTPDTLAAFKGAEEALAAAALVPEPVVEIPTEPDHDPNLLDRRKPYGTVTGEGAKKFWQAGKYFDYQGVLIE